MKWLHSKKIKSLIDVENSPMNQIYNCDETSLNYKMIPTKSLAAKTETAAHRRMLRMQLTMIGKAKNPRAF